MKTATGYVTALYGPEEVVFKINRDIVKFPVFIVDITDDCLVEIDCLRSYKATIALGDESVELVLPDSRKMTLRVHIGHLFARLVVGSVFYAQMRNCGCGGSRRFAFRR